MKPREYKGKIKRKFKGELKGEITVFLSLLLVVLLTFIGGMVQSASIHITKSMKRADTKLALESVFAEYEDRLLEEYDIFAKLDGDETKFSRRLWFYGAKDMEHKIQKIQFLTDNKGQAFYEQAIHSLGGEVKKVAEVTEVPWEEEERQVNLELEELLSETEVTLPKEENPLEWIKHLRKSSLLTLVLKNPENLSNRYVALEELPSHRKLVQGTGGLVKGTDGFGETSKGGVAQKALFTAYLMEHFPHHLKNKEENSLFYEAEYLLCGKESDRENLEAVFRKIITIRTGVNYAYLLTDQTKLAEAGGMAATLSGLLMIPEATELVKQALLFSWSYGESILELRSLSEGKKIPILKTAESWQLDLDSLLQLGTEEDVSTPLEEEKGMGYEDYITMFLLAENVEHLCMRALDLMELKLGIRMDALVTAVEIKSTAEMQRGIKDTFLSKYQYQ